MTRAKRMMEEQIKLVDVVVEMLDARIPLASTNPLLTQIIGQKPRIIALNKVDMAEDEQTELWLTKFRKAGIGAVKVDCATGHGVRQLVTLVQQAAQPVLDKWLKKGVRNRSVRVMIVGIPNVGKSTLINRLVGKNKVVAQNRPGVTKGQQWVTIAKGLDLLDTPGVLWPKFEDAKIGFALAITGAVKEDVFDKGQAAELLLQWLMDKHREQLQNFYKVEVTDIQGTFTAIAKARGFVKSGGVLDVERAKELLLRDFKTAKIGKFTIDEINT